MFKKNYILGVGVSEVSEKEVLEYIITGLGKNEEKYYVVTPNPEILVIANKNSNYKKVLNGARLALPDGVGVLYAGKILGKTVKERITGVDLVEKLCKGCVEKPITIGFLGAGPGVAGKAVECLKTRYPSLTVAFAESGSADSKTVELVKSKSGQEKGIDLLFVAFGSPKQELWIAENLDKLPVKVAIGVGGAFDFISGNVKRAPKWIRSAGFEWLFRLIIQPWRIKRQISLITFSFLIIKDFLLQNTTKK